MKTFNEYLAETTAQKLANHIKKTYYAKDSKMRKNMKTPGKPGGPQKHLINLVVSPEHHKVLQSSLKKGGFIHSVGKTSLGDTHDIYQHEKTNRKVIFRRHPEGGHNHNVTVVGYDR